jgi:hypothetical protein
MKSKRKRHQEFAAVTVTCLFGPLVWALHLALLYGSQHVLCTTVAGDLRDRSFHWSVALLTLIFIAVLFRAIGSGRIIISGLRSDVDEHLSLFLVYTMRWLSGLAIVGILWTALTLAFTTSCEPIR